jgi:Chitobiase/beta-hexosaminidase C-terminal domain/Legume lectin domain
MLTNRYLFLALIALGFLIPASAQTNVFNCSSFSSTGACAAVQAGYGSQSFIIRNGGVLSGSQIDFVPANSGHNGYGLWYYTPVNIQAFTTTFTFIPNGQNIAFVVQNTTNNPGYQGNIFASGAGCEAGFYQAFVSGENYPNNLFALELDSSDWLTEANAAFTYSSAQIYQSNQSPCLPNDNAPNWVPLDKISTSPVPLDSPANTANTTTGHVYSATITYDGTNLAMSMYDVSAGGSCPGSTCFTHVWPANLPSLVGGTTAYVGFTAGINIPNLPALYVNSWSYTVGSTTGSGNPTQAATPTFSLGAGTYTSAQSVTVSDATAGATIYYTTDGTTPTTSSTKYTGPITVGSTETLQAISVATGDANSTVASAIYTIGSPSPDPGNAPVINYPNGFAADPSQLFLANGSGYSGSSIELTKSSVNLANNAWYKTPVNVQAFTTTFTWTASCPQSGACGDGMGFMIISNSNSSSAGFNYSGSPGSQFSWSRCTDSCPSVKSILVKFDLYNNSTWTDGANLTGFYSGGVNPQSPQPQFDMAPSGINMQSGHPMKATLTYNGTVLMETVTDTVTGATYRNSYSANIPAMVGGNTALVGFGGSTGGAFVTQNLQSWTYTVE